MVRKDCLFVLLIIAQNFLLGGCGFLTSEDEVPTFKRREYLGNEFRMDGYYYHDSESHENSVTTKNLGITFFNRNGTEIFTGIYSYAGLEKAEADFKSGKFFSDNIKNKDFASIFKVEGGKIISEGWVNPYGTYLIIRDTFEITNDTTLTIISSEHRDGSKRVVVSEVYHFKQFSPKIDSSSKYFD